MFVVQLPVAMVRTFATIIRRYVSCYAGILSGACKYHFICRSDRRWESLCRNSSKGLGLVGKNQEKQKSSSVKVKKNKPGGGKPQSPPPPKPVETREERDVLGKQVREKRKIREREDEAARKEKLRRRSAEAEAKECIERDRLERPEDGVSYRFNLEGTIRRIFVTQEMADQLSGGAAWHRGFRGCCRTPAC